MLTSLPVFGVKLGSVDPSFLIFTTMQNSKYNTLFLVIRDFKNSGKRHSLRLKCQKNIKNYSACLI